MPPTRHLTRLFPAVTIIFVISVQLTAAAASDSGSASASPSKFGPKWNSLIGEWKGENESAGSSAICGFHFDLSEHVIVRTNHAELSASGAPHNDLMVLSPDSTPDKAKAIYFDNEGHTIDYSAEWAADGNTLTFISRPGPGPQFHLTYKKIEPEVFLVTFQMAPPGQPGAFKTHASGKIRRTGK